MTQCLCVQSDQDVDCPLHGSLAREKKEAKERRINKKSKTKNLIKALTTLAAADRPKALNKAVVVERHWSGHGEGGTLVYVVIDGLNQSNGYDTSNVEDRAKAKAAADYINAALEEYAKSHP